MNHLNGPFRLGAVGFLLVFWKGMGMIESIIVRPNARARHLQAPLLREREDYLAHLFRGGQKIRSLQSKASLLIHVFRLLCISAPREVTLDELQLAATVWSKDTAFHKALPASDRTAPALRRVALDFFRYHQWMTELPAHKQSFATLLADFTRYLRETKGLALNTIRSYGERAAEFLNWIAGRHDCLANVTLLDIDVYLDFKRSELLQPRTINVICKCLRALFLFVESQRGCVRNIAGGIRGMSVPKYDGTPRGPSWSNVRKLLRFPSEMSPGEIRTKAFLTLCAIYGLRSGEIVDLRLEDFDWYSEILTVRRGKRGRIQQFPLQFEVGEAILQYLKSVRPRCPSRHLFVTRVYPHKPVLSTTLRPLVAKRMIHLGIKSEKMGTHALRHACATELLKKGSSLKDIADFLGHRSLGSVSIYAKHDPRSLRAVAAFSLAGVL